MLGVLRSIILCHSISPSLPSRRCNRCSKSFSVTISDCPPAGLVSRLSKNIVVSWVNQETDQIPPKMNGVTNFYKESNESRSMWLTMDPRRMRRLIHINKTRISDWWAKRIHFLVPSLACLWPIHTYFKARSLSEVHQWPLVIVQCPCCYNSQRTNITTQSSSSEHLHHIESHIPIKLLNRETLKSFNFMNL